LLKIWVNFDLTVKKEVSIQLQMLCATEPAIVIVPEFTLGTLALSDDFRDEGWG
jgi:hypothetical protein